MNMSFVQALITKHEGFRSTVYRDTAGKRTIGIGLNLDDPLAQETCQAHDLLYEALLNGLPITLTDANAIRDGAILDAVFAGKCQFPNWDTLPDDAQAVIVDMIFNMGPARFAEFRKMIAALKNSDYAGAAEQMKASRWFTEVPSRAKEDYALMAACS